MEELLVFTRFMLDSDAAETAHYMEAAKEKLHTLYPDKRVVETSAVTLSVETDSLYSETGIDTYELGLVDNEIPAIRCERDGRVITFRV